MDSLLGVLIGSGVTLAGSWIARKENEKLERQREQRELGKRSEKRKKPHIRRSLQPLYFFRTL